MIKKYKIACCVLGAIVLVLILALAITVFVFAGNIKAADGVENASGDIADTISEAVFLTTSYVGMVIFVFAIYRRVSAAFVPYRIRRILRADLQQGKMPR